MKIVSSFGLHKDDDGVWWLVQANGGVNAVGLKGDCPFKVDRRKCNHQIDLTLLPPSPGAWREFMEIRSDAKVDLMLPIPRRAEGVFNINAIGPQWGLLARMSSPIHPMILPAWRVNRKELYDELQRSNIQPFVIYDVTAGDTTFIRETCQYAGNMPRTLIYSAKEGFIPTFNSIQLPAGVKHRNLPWEQIGAEVVRRFMRGDWE